MNIEYLNQLFDYSLYVPEGRKGNLPSSHVGWLPLKCFNSVHCKIRPGSSEHQNLINDDDLNQINSLTARNLLGFPPIYELALRKYHFFDERSCLRIVLTPNYARFLVVFRHDSEPVVIEGKWISAIAFGDQTKFSLVLPKAGARSLITLHVIEY
jgi:hypothetical protein